MEKNSSINLAKKSRSGTGNSYSVVWSQMSLKLRPFSRLLLRILTFASSVFMSPRPLFQFRVGQFFLLVFTCTCQCRYVFPSQRDRENPKPKKNLPPLRTHSLRAWAIKGWPRVTLFLRGWAEWLLYLFNTCYSVSIRLLFHFENSWVSANLPWKMILWIRDDTPSRPKGRSRPFSRFSSNI